ncbi:MAG: TAT-variant-translocated molybdopterin oxidoreductase [Pyrinomonadaceae bacterium]
MDNEATNYVQIEPLKKSDKHFDFQAFRRTLQDRSGKEYWRSLDELSDTEEFQAYLGNEFPSQAETWLDPVGRRTFMKLMAASLAFAGVSACTVQPPENIVPYVRQPEEIIVGKPLFFATAMPFPGGATGLLVRSNEGRPTKVEGNTLHPGSLGATDLFAQASILTMYDPDRAQTILYRGQQRTWADFLGEMRKVVDEATNTGGAGLHLLTGNVTSPTLASQLDAFRRTYPAAKWHVYEPAGHNNTNMGARLAFDQFVNTIYRFSQADRVLAIDSNFLAATPGNIRYTREFRLRQRVEDSNGGDIARLYAIESTPTNTGMLADHRLALRPSEIESFVRAIAAGVGAGGANAGTTTNNAAPNSTHAKWISALVKDLQAHRGRSIVIAGDEQSPQVHALAHAINAALGNIGQTVLYTDSIEAHPTDAQGNAVDQMQSLRELMQDIDAGAVKTLVILGGNPVYDAPVDLNFGARFQKVPLRVQLGLFNDETAELCHWHIPEAHYLESWSDTRAFDGTASIIQPLIAPLYGGRTTHEILAVLLNEADRLPYDIVRGYWQTQYRGGDFETFWRKSVHDGVIAGTAFAPKNFAVKADAASANQPANSSTTTSGGAQGYEIVFRPDPSVYDGRFANNGWLQELPKPLTKLTWDNAVMVSPNTAKSLGLFDSSTGLYRNGEQGNDFDAKGGDHTAEIVEINYAGRKVRGPLWVLPGQPDNCITVHLGYGRTRAGRVGTGTSDNPVGFNAYQIRTSDALWFGTGAKLTKTGEGYELATSQLHFNMAGREIIRAATLEEYRKNPDFAPKETHEPPPGETMYQTNPGYEYKGYKWGMSIDLSTCVGCNACVIACQAENNIPVVGKEQVIRSREMHWLRVDAYFRGALENPEGVSFMPVPCMQCENAPCEPVCPVAATVHDTEGLNVMVYNRCIGTRYCSNNCPYKVRRFNFLLYQDWYTPSLKLMRNPEVSVRSRGVMEKCTYCIQRIQSGKIESEKENRPIRDGEVQTACMSVCPADAIVFGDMNDENSRVHKMKEYERDYGLLAELNTRPRTTYLAEIRNPNPEMEGAKA